MSNFTTFNLYKQIKPSPARFNIQVLPLVNVEHYAPSQIGNTSGFISAYQLMAGALAGAPSSANGAGVIQYTPPTATNLLAAYAGNQFRVSAGDVMRVLVFNTGGTGIVINASGVTGVTGGFSAGTGTSNNGLAGAETTLHINWLQVSADGNSGLFQIY